MFELVQWTLETKKELFLSSDIVCANRCHYALIQRVGKGRNFDLDQMTLHNMRNNSIGE